MLRSPAYGLRAAAAEDVVQETETWLRVLRSLERFEGRSSFRSWLYVILGNCARRRASTERRSVSLESGGGEVEPDLDESRFFPADHPRWAAMWTTLVSSWDDIPDERFDQLLRRGGRSRPFLRRLRRIELLRHATLACCWAA